MTLDPNFRRWPCLVRRPDRREATAAATGHRYFDQTGSDSPLQEEGIVIEVRIISWSEEDDL